MAVDNGVALDPIMKLLEAVKAEPKMGNVQFQATSKWMGGTKTEVTISSLFAGGTDIARPGRKFTLMIDEPGELGGSDQHPNPVEYLCAALCGCITAGIATNASLFDTRLEGIEVTVKMDNDLHGVLGIDKSISNGVSKIDYSVKLKGPDGKDKMIKTKETIDRKSPVLTTLREAVKMQTKVSAE